MGSINGSLDLMGRHRILENTLYKNEAEGNPVSFKTNVTKNVKECVVELSPKQDFNGYDHPWVGGAGKNLLRTSLKEMKEVNTTGTWSGNTYTRNGITFTPQFDSSGNVTGVLANGTASGTGLFWMHSQLTDLSNIDLILSGCPSGGSSSTYNMRVYKTGDLSIAIDIGSGISFNNTDPNTRIGIVIASGITVSNILYKPMIRLASVTDATFAPYSNICPIDSWGGKNLLKYPYRYGTTTLNGVTFTNNGDGTITVNGTATADTNYFMHAVGDISLSGTYILSGCPSGGSDTAYYLAPRVDTSWLKANRDYGDGATLSGTIDAMAITVANGCVCSNLTFKPMLRLATSQDPTWQPYRRIENIVSQTGKNLLDESQNGKGNGAGVNGVIGAIAGMQVTAPVYLPPANYVFSCYIGTENWNRRIHGYKSDGTWVRQITYLSLNDAVHNSTIEIPFTVTSDIDYVVVSYALSDINSQIELGSTATTYEPYNPTSQQYTVTWETEAGEVFGGTLNLTTGELIAEYAEAVIDGTGSITAQVYSANYPDRIRAWCTLTGTHAPNGNINCRTLPLYSDSFTMYAREGGWDQPWADSGHYNLEEANIGDCINVSQYPYSLCYILPFGGGYGVQENSIQAIKDYFAAHPVRIVGKLYTPVTYHLNPVQIKTLLETNVLTTDGDNIRVTYWKH